MMKKISLIILVLSFLTPCYGMTQTDKTVQAVRFETAPVIDGNIAEEIWKIAKPTEGFYQFTPIHGELSKLRTVVRIGYDNESIYVAFYCYDPDPQGIASAETNRDGGLGGDDAVAIMLDTFNDNSNGYIFVTNLLGTQGDLKIADNGRSTDDRWDSEWQCAASIQDDGWSAEFAIPFKSLRYKASENPEWGINFVRTYPRGLEEDIWSGPTESIWRVSEFGTLAGLELNDQAIKKWEIIPYAMFHAEEGRDSDGEIGLDLRYRLSSNLYTELTLNPDFATVEADVETINLTRFEIRVPEKRPFFLEGGELFRQRINQFYSRRIGDIPWGGKLTGKVGSWDLALIGAQSDPAKTIGAYDEESNNATYAVIRAKRGILGNSNIGFLATNRRWLGHNQGSVGVDTTLFFTDTLGMTAQFIRAHGPENDGKLAWFIRPSFDSANSHFHVRYSNMDTGLMENMNTLGFISDDDRKEFDTNLSHTFWFEDSWIEKIELGTNYNQYWSQEGILRSWESDTEVEISLSSKWDIDIEHTDEFERYEKDFRNRITSLELSYDTRDGRSFSVSYGFGDNYDSNLRLIEVGTSLKITDAWNVGYRLTKLWLDPDPEEESTWIHVLRTNYYINKDFFFKLFFQTNSIIDKKNVQALTVWRFLPPFGAMQIAYQYGTSRFGTSSDQGHTLFTKLSWVF